MKSPGTIPASNPACLAQTQRPTLAHRQETEARGNGLSATDGRVAELLELDALGPDARQDEEIGERPRQREL
eukprot:8361479-Lingulodinium_polyedra.AAC.1